MTEKNDCQTDKNILSRIYKIALLALTHAFKLLVNYRNLILSLKWVAQTVIRHY